MTAGRESRPGQGVRMREVWTVNDQVRLFAVEGGEGPVLVFLHGGLADHRAVLPLVGPLTDRYRVVLPDVRGNGRSWFSGTPTFDLMAEDLLQLLDHLEVEEALVGGISSGSGAAIRFALRFPERTRGLVIVHPVYAGSDRGYTESQATAFAAMDAAASRAGVEGIEALRPLFFDRLPEGMRERAWQIASEFDPGSVVATSRFIARGAQPFATTNELRSLRAPTLTVCGDDDVHPAYISELYSSCLPECTTVPATTRDIGQAIRRFCDGLAGV